MPAVEILLATFEGARFLPAQLDSLWAQSDPDFQVLARDDGSCDETPAILRRHAEAHPGRLRLLEDGGGAGDPTRNFARLLEASRAPFVALCDQDDVWLPDHLALARARMAALEARHGAATPLLVHGDLEVVDAELRPLGPSFWRYQKLDPRAARRLNRALVQNVVTGCTCLLNRALVEKALPVPDDAVLHDWWLALVACAFGAVGEVPQPVVRYRQHGANAAGARRWQVGRALLRAFRTGELRVTLALTQRQAAVFLDRYGSELSPRQRATAAAYAGLSRRGFWGRRWTLLRHGLFKVGALRNLGLLARA
jgi:glycosyltransferase involved in cell wall biosynthesis